MYFERRKALKSSDDTLKEVMLEYSEKTIDDIVKANIDVSVPVEEWPLDGLASKCAQYCKLMSDLTEDILREEANKGGVEGLQNYLVKRGKDAYLQKRGEIEALQPGLMAEAERYFV